MRSSWMGVVILATWLISGPAASQSAEDVGKTAGNIVTKPMKDVNLLKDEIPPLLLSASAAPYSLGGLRTCQQLATEIGKLDSVLGPDVDKLPAKDGETAGEVALGGVESLVGGLIPGTGLIRKISGAEAHAKKVQAAFYAGGLRRAYLKGTARAKGCKL